MNATATDTRTPSLAFEKFAWTVLAWNILVVLWGAYVRATGSGAGCGEHWPLCNGEVVPRPHSMELVIEFTHRLTSGLAALLVAGLCVWAWRRYPSGHAARKWAVRSLVFMIIEALLGAGLVLFRLVVKDASLARGIVMPLHLANTLVLLACITATAWYSRKRQPSGPGLRNGLLVTGLLLTVAVGMTGAVAALGDTLFPATSFREGLRQELSTGSHVLLRLRLVHPALSLLNAVVLLFAAASSVRSPVNDTTKRLALGVVSLVFVQVTVGVLNVVLLAPVWMQLVHLLLADLLWVTLVSLYLSRRT